MFDVHCLISDWKSPCKDLYKIISNFIKRELDVSTINNSHRKSRTFNRRNNAMHLFQQPPNHPWSNYPLCIIVVSWHNDNLFGLTFNLFLDESSSIRFFPISLNLDIFVCVSEYLCITVSYFFLDLKHSYSRSYYQNTRYLKFLISTLNVEVSPIPVQFLFSREWRKNPFEVLPLF